MLKRKAEVFAPTDGVLTTTTGITDGRGLDYSDTAPYVAGYRLAYRRVRISSRDVELADATGSEITAKVEVRTAPSLTPDTDVLIRSKVYEVTRVEDRGRTSWLWLSEVACDGTCELSKQTVTYDENAVPHRADAKAVVYVRKVSLGSKRAHSAGVDSLDATMSIRIRSVDYDDERTVKRGGVTYSVITTETHGRWIDLVCRERGADR